MQTTDLDRAYSALTTKKPRIDSWWRYYDGDHILPFISDRLREVFRDLSPDFNLNWCEAVIDATADRISLTGLTAQDEAATDALKETWDEAGLGVEADDAHKAALVTGEGYVCVWQDGAYGLQAYYNDPRMIHVEYSAHNPHVKAWAAKWWDEGGYRRLTLYYPDRLEYYISRGKAESASSAKAFIPYDGDGEPVVANPYGVVPVFHFRPERRLAKSDLSSVWRAQNAVNMLLINLLVAGEFGALPQKWLISQVDLKGRLPNHPGGILSFPASEGDGQGTQVGQFQAASLANFWDAIDPLIGSIASITRTPKHYFVRQGGDPSGDALAAMESPLLKKVQDRIDRFAIEWRQAGAFLLQLRGVQARPTDITPRWADIRTTQPLANAMSVREYTSAGVPLRTALRRAGWTEDELAKMDEDQQAEQVTQPQPPVPTPQSPMMTGGAPMMSDVAARIEAAARHMGEGTGASSTSSSGG